ncbi:hypothetical protein [Dictyobacter kobayashii]|uniref:Uncharacterized protein n=1 Tax=Dictyobacter kobayashii TaxID=2014872 RepID=A0A402ACE7_9CHLR|nr:hypothetical protein [Dictyobacter kobayashii]GCE16765.1 hypothetical protein KDK_05650 [Dictyobacter kobayashii]
MTVKEDEYYDGLYQILVNILHHEQLSWIVHDVTEQIVMGKVKIPTPEEKKKAPRGKVPGTYSTSYTAKERVQLLIDSIRYIVVNNASIEKEVLLFYLEPDAGSQTQKRPQSVVFSSQVEPEDVVVIDRQQSPLRYARAQKLGMVLNRLQELLNDGH